MSMQDLPGDSDDSFHKMSLAVCMNWLGISRYNFGAPPGQNQQEL